MNKDRLILGSSSTIRRMILETSIYDFDIYNPDIDETLYEYLEPIEKVKKIAFEKNRKISELEKYQNSIIIAADTLCLLPNGITLQKPSNIDESIKMSMQQSGQTIKAITGISISFVRNNKRIYITKYSSTKITYLDFTEHEIFTLIKKFNTTNKASGLGIWNDSPGFSFVKKFNGSYTGALGLPMEIVREVLTKIYD
jgi:septum formation protein